MLHINALSKSSNYFIALVIALTLVFTACSNDENPVDSNVETAKVSGRISSQSSSQSLAKDYGVETVDGATVVLAQVQADGSLKTVSTQSVQTDINGRFTLETSLNNSENLIVIAEKNSTKWKAVVSSKVQSGTTVYAPPLNSQTTAESDLFIKVVSHGYSNEVSLADIRLYLNAQAAAQIHGNTDTETKFVTAVRSQSQTRIQAAGNSYFGLTNTQIQAILKAKADACAKMDEELYRSNDSEIDIETVNNNYANSVLAVYASNNINSRIYAELLRVSMTSYHSASTSINSQVRLATTKSFYLHYSLIMNHSMKQQFQAAGASAAQVNSVNSSGLSLYTAIKNSNSQEEINNAFVQYHSSIKAQLNVVLSPYSTLIDTIDATINAAGGAKVVLSTSLSVGISANAIINAYVTFFNTVKTTTQTALSTASSAQVNAASQILILINMN